MSLARRRAQTRALIREAPASRQCEALPRHKRVSARHKAVKVPFPWLAVG